MRKNFLWILFVIILTGVILWPLLRPGFYQSDDGEWMVIRLSAFYQTLRDGQFPTRFLGRLNYQYGYPVANFLYPGFLYLGSAIHVLGISFVDSVKFILAGSIIGSALLIFKALKKDFENIPSLLGTAGFILAPYLAYDLYVRGSVGEILVLLPASLGFYSITTQKYWFFPLAISSLILSHNSAAVIFLLFFLCLILLKKVWGFLLPLAIGTGMASFFWMPALYDRKYVVFNSISVSDPSHYFLEGSQLFLVGLVGLASACIVFFSKKKASTIVYFMAGMLFFGAYLATGLSSFLWNIKPLAALIQFPYRFLLLTLIPGSFLIAWVASSIRKRRTVFIVFGIAVSFFSLMPISGNISYIQRTTGFYTTNEATTTVQDEYMPKWVQIKPTTHADKKIVFYKGGGQFQPLKMNTQTIIGEIISKGESTLQINTIYYPGWGVLIDDQPVKIDYKNPEGVIRFAVPNGKHKIVATFHETISRFAADTISLISLLGYILYIAFRKKYEIN